MHFARAAAISGLLLGNSYAATIPTNVQNFYNSLVSKGSCSNKLKTGLTAVDGGPDSRFTLSVSTTSAQLLMNLAFSYCGDHLSDYNVMYIQGTGGALVDMDVDCDGQQGGLGDDGRCGSSQDTQSITAFQDTVAGYKKGINDLNAFVHPYVVFGNYGSRSGFVTFDPQQYGVEPLSVMAVVCNNQLVS